MVLRVYNTLTRRKEDFRPIDDNKVKMFVCGPTVYDLCHLGHARTYVAFDVIAKWLRYRGYDLFYLMNITNIDDKIIKIAKEKGKDPLDLANEFEDLFLKDMNSLRIDSINLYARASDHISEIIDQIRRLLERGFAYFVETGVYFDVTKFRDYGRLSHQNPEELKKHRIEPDPHKRNAQDFSLWKRRKEGEPYWSSPWGEGRPGWHIEDTAIAEKYLGQQYDIHGGGIDLIFPHHEAEIAQMETISEKRPMVRYWLHTGFLKVRGKKMAKSLRNFVTIQDAVKDYGVETLRLFFSSTHYRSTIDFCGKGLEQTKKRLESLYATLERVRRVKDGSTRLTENEGGLKEEIEKSKRSFEEAMDDDFNTPLALAHLHGLATSMNRLLDVQKSVNSKLADEFMSTFKELGGILGILQKQGIEEELPRELIMLIKERERSRKKKDWRIADGIRKRLEGFGIILEDTKEGVRWKKKS
jgi:cysteinyl-tRNA synthetase